MDKSETPLTTEELMRAIGQIECIGAFAALASSLTEDEMVNLEKAAATLEGKSADLAEVSLRLIRAFGTWRGMVVGLEPAVQHIIESEWQKIRDHEGA